MGFADEVDGQLKMIRDARALQKAARSPAARASVWERKLVKQSLKGCKTYACWMAAAFPMRWTIILGDHTDMTPEEDALIEQAGAKVVSLGSTSLHADHCIVLLNWFLDTKVFMPL